MVWQTTGPNGEPGDIKVGSHRPTMDTNPLLAKPGLGTVKPTLFNSPHPDHCFGYNPPKDPEGAREVMMIWKSADPNAAIKDIKPSADFKTLNKMATGHGLSTAKEQPPFRKEHTDVVVKTTYSQSPTKRNTSTVPPAKASGPFGMPSTYRTAEVVRSCGPEEPKVKYIMQGAYQDEWMRSKLEAEAAGEGKPRPYIPPAPTRAVMGHSFGASRYMQPPNHEEPWKMSKFKTVGPKVTQFNGTAQRQAAAAAGGYPEDAPPAEE